MPVEIVYEDAGRSNATHFIQHRHASLFVKMVKKERRRDHVKRIIGIRKLRSIAYLDVYLTTLSAGQAPIEITLRAFNYGWIGVDRRYVDLYAKCSAPVDHLLWMIRQACAKIENCCCAAATVPEKRHQGAAKCSIAAEVPVYVP